MISTAVLRKSLTAPRGYRGHLRHTIRDFYDGVSDFEALLLPCIERCVLFQFTHRFSLPSDAFEPFDRIKVLVLD
jgi:hypothetical protein